MKEFRVDVDLILPRPRNRKAKKRFVDTVVFYVWASSPNKAEWLARRYARRGIPKHKIQTVSTSQAE